MSLNNFDTSSSGVGLELACHYDADLARMWFDSDFKVLQHSGYRTTAKYLYTEGGEFSDFEKEIYIDESKKPEILRAYISEFYNDNAREFLEDFRHYCGKTKSAGIEDIKDFYLQNISNDEDEQLEFLKQFGMTNFVEVSATGFSQKDYCKVVVPKASAAYKNVSLDFNNMIYNQPLYINLIVDNEEHYLDQELEDCYNYDEKEIIEIAGKLLENHDKKDYIICWLEENLPKYPQTY